jgi:hypothetical protein
MGRGQAGAQVRSQTLPSREGRVSDLRRWVIALTETAQFCSSKVLTVWLRH